MQHTYTITMSSSNAVFDVSFLFIDQMFQDLAFTSLKTSSAGKLAPRFHRLDKQILFYLVWKMSAFIVMLHSNSKGKKLSTAFPRFQPLSSHTLSHSVLQQLLLSCKK